MRLAGKVVIDGDNRLVSLDGLIERFDAICPLKLSFDSVEESTGFRPMWFPCEVRGLPIELVIVDDDVSDDSPIWLRWEPRTPLA